MLENDRREKLKSILQKLLPLVEGEPLSFDDNIKLEVVASQVERLYGAERRKPRPRRFPYTHY